MSDVSDRTTPHGTSADHTTPDHTAPDGTSADHTTPAAPRDALVVVASTRAAAGVYRDTSGALAVEWLRSRGFTTPDAVVVPDADIPRHLGDLLSRPDDLPRVLLTTGGTGPADDDLTVGAVRPHLDREFPGVMAEFWRRGAESVPTAVLSGGVAGTVGRTFVMTLPGSRGGVRDGIAVLDPLIDHLTALLEGRTAHD
ncbi:MogA/MoaB family molybdenum cofactor biosynthesis protein [Corynebacterium bovis]|uniref:MogA/MoaB family molybdenum cofactor biosynthesis protein n=1 Tax=Corynebacterium bovis TaxID=36808 RepID=UPI003139AE59